MLHGTSVLHAHDIKRDAIVGVTCRQEALPVQLGRDLVAIRDESFRPDVQHHVRAALGADTLAEPRHADCLRIASRLVVPIVGRHGLGGGVDLTSREHLQHSQKDVLASLGGHGAQRTAARMAGVVQLLERAFDWYS